MLKEIHSVLVGLAKHEDRLLPKRSLIDLVSVRLGEKNLESKTKLAEKTLEEKNLSFFAAFS